LLVRSVTRVDAALLAGTPVRFVGSATAGVDHIDQEWLAANGITFASAPGSNARAVAEYVLAVVLHYAQRRGCPPETLSVAIVGCGHAGGEVLALLGALGITCRPVDPPRARLLSDRPYEALDAVLDCDVLTLHTPLTVAGPDATRDLLNAARLAVMKPGALLINAARGGIVDELALAPRAADGSLVAALDCWCDEPAISSGLLGSAAIATPHIAGHTVDAKARGTAMIHAALVAQLAAGAAHNGAALLPACEQLAVAAPGPDGDPWSALRAAVSACYDVARDSERLKTAAAAAAPAEVFDRCRGDRRRREFSACRIQRHVHDATDHLVRTAGFKFEHDD
ncbi:MAG: 4-phosphoerythronate dehydrogenase, partial [Gammaproteobacteria bacterium]|nr:4-phosphoerythronate dehydrogenase [Gammaproteobacteria bacterium]